MKLIKIHQGIKPQLRLCDCGNILEQKYELTVDEEPAIGWQSMPVCGEYICTICGSVYKEVNK